ncbi:MAG: 50S ribosomal protein L30 [DPANN group archaeon]|nr:50S ribosomal protein L30 [DPANN group archaeon]
MIAIIRVRGTVNVNYNVKKTLQLLRLTKPNHCVIVSDNDVFKGMIKHAKDVLTWGNISEKTLKSLVEKRGKLSKTKKVDAKNVDQITKMILEGKINDAEIKPVFMLTPPRKGFGPNGVKKTYNLRGGLGNRNEDINDLIERMI